MDRNTLIAQVKSEYAAMSVTGRNGRPQSFYENLTGQIVNAIQSGRFDNFQSGRQIIDAVSGQNAQWLDRPKGFF